ncbi:helix-turn-helix domain-containing protein [uncultured Cohaesibacter sp.]|uniref:helix-turn-helix domain-containing protein n=1 Tax=uncultured Cohaesibacter sp. TaxID=1002546 RepID=UPI002A0A33DB|nr:helix-turn-helix domain-containing protein [uncultured Cohaesibacter sp.]
MNSKPPFELDGAIPAHPELDPSHPLVIFDDHRFCAGTTTEVRRMAGPHMHSQIEINYVLEGQMTYWFDGRELTLSADRLCLFWGMSPHQVTDRKEGTKFVCLYMPMSAILGMANLPRLRAALFRGAVIEALSIRPYDRQMFLDWRKELLAGDANMEEILRSELVARVKRIENDGWRDLREQGEVLVNLRQCDVERIHHIEQMLRFISENALRKISVDDVAEAAGLHPNYAMMVFKRTMGSTINQAIVRHRLDTARSLLISTELTVVEIAFESGFGSLSTFYDAFQKRFNEKPMQFRKQMRSKNINKSLSNAGKMHFM